MDDSTLALARTLAAAARAERPSLEVGDTLVPNRMRALAGDPSARSGFDLGKTIGMGGMGVVREGTQRSLDRSVAIKTLRDELRGQVEPTRGLLREARLTGAVQHPNVVPVHDVAVDPDGMPMIVLKKIAGTTWSDLVCDAARTREVAPSGDLLDFNLRTLMQVASAVHFAHQLGIVHRDLKPANVMIGDHGEVYLVDWGIALQRGESDTHDDVSLHAPAGTPCYMAPEMLGIEGAPPISARSDVYLLGAILFEILAGRPPHRSGQLYEVFARILTEEPALPEGLPDEIAGVCQRAMARDPSERFDSADAFRRAVAHFLDHRAATELVTEAERRLAQLLGRLGDPKVGEADAIVLYNVLGACRFGFRQALRGWPESERAKRGLESALEAMTAYEIRCKNPRAAKVLLAEMSAPSATLRADLEAAERARALDEAEVSRLRTLGRDLDPRHGQAGRVVIALVLGIVWILGPVSLGWVEAWQPDVFRTQWTVIGGSLGVALFAGVLWTRSGATLLRTTVNRRFAIAVFLALGMQSVLFFGEWLGGVDVAWSEASMPLLWGTVLAMVSANVEPRLWPTTLAQCIAFLLAATHLEWRFYAMGAAMAATTLNFFVIWGRSAAGATSSSDGEARDRPTLAPEP